jgi:hypothetical protein
MIVPEQDNIFFNSTFGKKGRSANKNFCNLIKCLLWTEKAKTIIMSNLLLGQSFMTIRHYVMDFESKGISRSNICATRGCIGIQEIQEEDKGWLPSTVASWETEIEIIRPNCSKIPTETFATVSLCCQESIGWRCHAISNHARFCRRRQSFLYWPAGLVQGTIPKKAAITCGRWQAFVKLLIMLRLRG